MTALCDGRVAIVTGAGRGLGRAYALELARHGARVVVNDLGVSADGSGRAEGPAREVVDMIRAAGGEAVVSFEDVADWAGARRILYAALDAWGRLDVLVNNAGDNRRAEVERITLADWTYIWEVNTTSTFLCSRAAIEPMRAAGGGRIINVTSLAGKRGSATRGSYSAAKFGVHGLSEALAAEVKPFGILVTCICPGAVATALRARSVPGEDQSTLLAPEDVAEAVLFAATRGPRVVLPEICLWPIIQG